MGDNYQVLAFDSIEEEAAQDAADQAVRWMISRRYLPKRSHTYPRFWLAREFASWSAVYEGRMSQVGESTKPLPR